MVRPTALLIPFLIFAPAAASAAEIRLGDLVIDTPHSYATPPMARSGAGYMSITNTGTEDDRLLSAEAGFTDAQIHLTETEADGVMKMVEQVDGVAIPAGQTVTFQPGGLHVMFMGLAEPFVTGEVNEVTLSFERAGEVTLGFEVVDRPSGTGMMHGHGQTN